MKLVPLLYRLASPKVIELLDHADFLKLER